MVRGSNIILIVYSKISRESFNEVEFWINFVKENVGDDKYIMALVANKNDLYEYDEVKYEEGKEVAKKYGIEFLTTSALKEGKLFQEFLNELIKIYIENYLGPENIVNVRERKNLKININGHKSRNKNNIIGRDRSRQN